MTDKENLSGGAAGPPLPIAAPGTSVRELLRRAVTLARDGTRARGEDHARWLAVMGAFAIGQAEANVLCLRFGLDPNEMVHL